MRIDRLGNLADRDRSRLILRVDLAKSADMFGDCEGVRVTVEQKPDRREGVCFVDAVLSLTEALNLSNRLREAFDRALGRQESTPISNPDLRRDEMAN